MKKLLAFLGLVVVSVLFFIGLTLGSEQNVAEHEPPVSLPAVGTVAGEDLQALTDVFGCPVPYGIAMGSGQVSDARLDTLQARLLTWQGSDGLVITAVRPVEAAQLLRRDGLTLDNSTLWASRGHTLLMGIGQDAACAYYNDDNAAYCLYLYGADAQQLLTVLNERVTFPH